MILEVCVDSIGSMLTAKEAGADRIELCSALNIGGITPSVGFMEQAKGIDGLEVFVMIRPRSGDFLYDTHEFQVMKSDIEVVKKMGFDGIVTGILKSDGLIDIVRMNELVEHAKPLKVVMHRAFDHAKNAKEYVPELIEMGICRILTSGQKANALEGVEYIGQLQEAYGDKITIMPGAGVNGDNIEHIMSVTKCTNYHLSGKVDVGSNMSYRECIVGMGESESEFVVERTDYDKVHAVRSLLDSKMK